MRICSMATALILAYAILFVATAFMAYRFFALWVLACSLGLAVFAASATREMHIAVLKIIGATTVWAIIVACTTWGIL